MECRVFITRNAQKDLRRIPKNIVQQLDIWTKLLELEGFQAMQEVRGYRDHSLKGDRMGQRSSSLSRSWRVIYTLDENTNLITVEVLEVSNHDY